MLNRLHRDIMQRFDQQEQWDDLGVSEMGMGMYYIITIRNEKSTTYIKKYIMYIYIHNYVYIYNQSIGISYLFIM